MERQHVRQTAMLLAALGLALAARQVASSADEPPSLEATRSAITTWLRAGAPPSPAAGVTPRRALAEDLEVYQLSISQGLDYSIFAFRSVEGLCRDNADDPTIVRACNLFQDALAHPRNTHEIDDAVRLLQSDG